MINEPKPLTLEVLQKYLYDIFYKVKPVNDIKACINVIETENTFSAKITTPAISVVTGMQGLATYLVYDGWFSEIIYNGKVLTNDETTKFLSRLVPLNSKQ